MVNTDWFGAFTINTTINAKAIIQAVILSFKFFIVVWGFNCSTNINKKSLNRGIYKKIFVKFYLRVFLKFLLLDSDIVSMSFPISSPPCG